MHGMLLIVPPTCDLTVPLLGVYQMAGYADYCGFPLSVCDFNVEFCKEIVSYSVSRARFFQNVEASTEEQLEELAIAVFLAQYPQITGYDSLLNGFRDCTNPQQYWELVDYLRACYDMYSLQFEDIRFRIDGFDSKYKWNIWADIDSFINKYSNSPIMDALREMILKSDFRSYDTVGISVTFESQLFFALLIGKALRTIQPNLNIVIGGGFVNSFIDCKEAMGPVADYCDCVFAGEGEALIEFLNNSKAGAVSSNKQECFSAAQYFTPGDVCKIQLQVQPPRFTSDSLFEQFSPKRIIPLRFSYDCYWGKCKFCSDKETHVCLKKEYDIQRMIDFCIDAVSNNRIDGIYFLDSAIKPRDVRRFATAMINAEQTIPWGTNLRFEKAFDDDSLIDLMTRSGCVFAKFGLESGSQRVLDLMNKGTDVNVVASIVSKFRKHGIFVHTYVMVGYPGELPEDRQKTKDFLLSEFSHPDNYNCSEFILYGSAEIAKEYDHMLKTNDFGGDGWHSSQYESFTSDTIQDFVAEMRKEFDKLYKPQSVLMSTGHTIAYANIFSHQQSTHSRRQNITLSKKLFYTTLNGTPCLLWWRRNQGCLYILGEWAVYLWNILSNGMSYALFLSLNIPLSFTELLWDNACLCDSDKADTIEPLPDMPHSNPEIMKTSHFSLLNWYGQFDAS